MSRPHITAVNAHQNGTKDFIELEEVERVGHGEDARGRGSRCCPSRLAESIA
jgi:hypothetical protein